MARCLVIMFALLAPASTAMAVNLTWTGAGGNDKWSTPANWSPAQVPASVDTLIFPSAVTTNNDRPAYSAFATIAFQNGGTVIGNAMTITRFIGGGAPATIDVPVRANAGAEFVQVILTKPLEVAGGEIVFGNTTYPQAGLSGSGSVWASGAGHVTGTSTFTGTIEIGNAGGFRLFGDMPATDFVVGARSSRSDMALIGNGIARNLTTSQWGVIAPGAMNPFNPADFPITPGSFTVANMQLAGRAQFIIDSAAASQLRVNGSATLGGTISLALKQGFSPSVGDGFRVIDKLSPGAISGTFSNAPAEGSTFHSGGYIWRVTYAGGNGNDVDVRVVGTAPRAATGLGWSGNAGDGKWSNPNNWRPALVPQAGDDLGIGYDVDVTNDLPAYTIYNSIIAGNATIRGNAISITTAFGSVDVRHLDRPTFKVPVRVVGTRVMLKNAALDAPLEMTGGTVWIHSAAYLNAGINGTGTIEGGPVVGGTSSFTGTFRVGGVVAMGSLPAAKVIDGPVLGTGLIGEVTEGTGWTIAPSVRDEDSWNPLLPGTLTIGKLQLAGTLDLLFTSGGTSKLKITQSITLNEATLAISTKPGFTSSGGNQYTVVDKRPRARSSARSRTRATAASSRSAARPSASRTRAATETTSC